jgi:hypothetical protein
MLAQYVPFPEYPESHWQVKDPSVSVQVALSWQLSVMVVHSSMSVQFFPFPEYPVLHMQ